MTDEPPPELSREALSGMMVEVLAELDALRDRALQINRQLTIAVSLNVIACAMLLAATLYRLLA